MLLLGRHLSNGQNFRIERLKLLLQSLYIATTRRLDITRSLRRKDGFKVNPIQPRAKRLDSCLDQPTRPLATHDMITHPGTAYRMQISRSFSTVCFSSGSCWSSSQPSFCRLDSSLSSDCSASSTVCLRLERESLARCSRSATRYSRLCASPST